MDIYTYKRKKKYLSRREISINNSTFSSCLHSKSVVLHAHLNLPENMP